MNGVNRGMCSTEKKAVRPKVDDTTLLCPQRTFLILKKKESTHSLDHVFLVCNRCHGIVLQSRNMLDGYFSPSVVLGVSRIEDFSSTTKKLGITALGT